MQNQQPHPEKPGQSTFGSIAETGAAITCNIGIYNSITFLAAHEAL
jgi:hypothetical protein